MNGRSIIMTANASARAIKPELLRTYTEDFNKDRANLIAADAAVSAGVLKAATDYRGVRALPRDFSIELKQGSIADQGAFRPLLDVRLPEHAALRTHASLES